MATQAEMRAEELVYEVAEELGLTEAEVIGLDAVAIADAALRRLRIELEQLVGRGPTVGDHHPPDPRQRRVDETAAHLEDRVEA